MTKEDHHKQSTAGLPVLHPTLTLLFHLMIKNHFFLTNRNLNFQAKTKADSIPREVGRKPTENRVYSEHTLLCQAHVTGSQECWHCSSYSLEISNKQEPWINKKITWSAKHYCCYSKAITVNLHLTAHFKRTPVPAKIQKAASAGTEPSLSSLDGVLEKQCPEVQ